MKLSRHFSLLASALLAGGGLLRAEENAFDALMRNSPFGTGPGAVPAERGAGGPGLEFRSFYTEGREQFFSIYDPVSQRAYWLQRGEATGALAVKEFSADRLALDIEYQGRAVTLALRQARVLTMAASQPAAPQPGPANSAAPADAVSGPPDPRTSGPKAVAIRSQLKQIRERLAAQAAPPVSTESR